MTLTKMHYLTDTCSYLHDEFDKTLNIRHFLLAVFQKIANNEEMCYSIVKNERYFF